MRRALCAVAAACFVLAAWRARPAARALAAVKPAPPAPSPLAVTKTRPSQEALSKEHCAVAVATPAELEAAFPATCSEEGWDADRASPGHWLFGTVLEQHRADVAWAGPAYIVDHMWAARDPLEVVCPHEHPHGDPFHTGRRGFRSVAERFARLGIETKVVKGFNRKHADWSSSRVDKACTESKPYGALCAMSHRLAWEHSATCGDSEWLFVVENDAWPHPKLAEGLGWLKGELAKPGREKAAMVYLGWCYSFTPGIGWGAAQAVSGYGSDLELVKFGAAYCTTAYLVRRSELPELLEAVTPFEDESCTIDGFLAKYQMEHLEVLGLKALDSAIYTKEDTALGGKKAQNFDGIIFQAEKQPGGGTGTT